MYFSGNKNSDYQKRQSGRVFGTLKAELEKRGIDCGEPDLRIAAVAIKHSLTLITGNTRHFMNIPGLRIEDWIGEGGTIF